MLYIDVRTKNEYESGHVKDSLHHDITEMMQGIFPNLSKDVHITVYCESGNRSMMAKSFMEKEGFLNVIDGGSIYDQDNVI